MESKMGKYTEIGKNEKMAGHTVNIDISGYYEIKSYNRLRPIMCIDLFILFFFKWSKTASSTNKLFRPIIRKLRYCNFQITKLLDYH